ncbi:GL11742 [Drosophila persimilis]|uniref:GL11742 n=1 Tax=Drosophila persimilis TaxID=7234 RepID=B4HCS7_DROPE|nr:GL11742 [Drosophila persimilis]
MALYCWADASHCQLGLGGIDNEQILAPSQIEFAGATDCLRTSPHALPAETTITTSLATSCPPKGHIACGSRHSMALTEWGQILSCGDNDCGQVGHFTDNDVIELSKILCFLVSKRLVVVVQIACGNNHSLALTSCGELYSWGYNIYGQLGVQSPKDLPHFNAPVQLTTILGTPLATIALLGWGKNTCGQLGLNDEQSRAYPSQLKTMRTLGVRFGASDEYSVCLTNEGGVFTCGAGNYGQLHGVSYNEMIPRMVMELMGSTITQVACGNRHTLALVRSGGRILSLTAEATQQCAHIKQSDLDLLQSMEVIFKSQACLNGSFLLSNDEHFDCSARNYGLDLKAAEVAFDHLRSVENESIKQVLMPYNADLDVILKVMNVLFIINNSRKERENKNEASDDHTETDPEGYSTDGTLRCDFEAMCCHEEVEDDPDADITVVEDTKDVLEAPSDQSSPL